MDLGLGSLLGGVASGISSAVSSRNALKAQRETNDLNYKIWGEQQQHNIDMFNMQNAANINMWDMQNAYNDPSAQIRRLSAAGLNPYLAMGNNPSGVATNAPASGTMNPSPSPTMQAPPAEAFDIGLDKAVGRVLQGLQVESQIGLNEKQGDKIGADTDQVLALTPILSRLYSNQADHEKSKIALTDESLENLRWNTNSQRLQYRLDKILFKEKAAQSRALTHTMQSQQALASLNVDSQETINKYLNLNQLLTVGNLAMSILESDATVKEKNAKVEELLSSAFLNRNLGKLKGIEFEALESAKQEYKDMILQQYLSARVAAGADFFENELNLLKNESDYQAFKDSPGLTKWDRYTKRIGDGLRNVAGGIISGSVGFGSTRSSSVSHNYMYR